MKPLCNLERLWNLHVTDCFALIDRREREIPGGVHVAETINRGNPDPAGGETCCIWKKPDKRNISGALQIHGREILCSLQ